MTDYYYKYKKYKTKYLKLMETMTDIDNGSNGSNGSNESIMDYESVIEDNIYNLAGGNSNIIIHISGPSGSGKTTLGNKLKYKFYDRIVVMDLDDLRYDFVKKEYGGFAKFKFNKTDNFDKNKYQKWIDDYIKKQTKPLILVGLNHMPWWHKDYYYNMHSNYNFYIKLDLDIIFKQKCNRFIEQTFIKNKNQMFTDIKKNEQSTIKFVSNEFKRDCSYGLVKKMNEIWNSNYKNQKYIFMSSEKIYERVCEILEEFL
jgi:adenylate kinase family enzyme